MPEKAKAGMPCLDASPAAALMKKVGKRRGLLDQVGGKEIRRGAHMVPEECTWCPKLSGMEVR